MSTQSENSRWRLGRYLIVAVVFLVLTTTPAVLLLTFSTSEDRSDPNRPFFGTWKCEHSILNCRPDGTVRWRSLNDPKVAYGRWKANGSQLTITYSGRNTSVAIITRLVGRVNSDAYPIVSISESSYVLATPGGNQMFTRFEDPELENAP